MDPILLFYVYDAVALACFLLGLYLIARGGHVGKLAGVLFLTVALASCTQSARLAHKEASKHIPIPGFDSPGR